MMDNLLKRIKAIADDTRMNIIKLLLRNNFCVKALARRLGISESAVSQHLKILREADIVMGEKKGYYVHYMVKKENLLKVSRAINNLVNDSNKDDVDGCIR